MVEEPSKRGGAVKIEFPTVKIEVPTVKIARLGGSKKRVFFNQNRCRGSRQNGILNRQNGILNRQNGNGGTKPPQRGIHLVGSLMWVNPLTGFRFPGLFSGRQILPRKLQDGCLLCFIVVSDLVRLFVWHCFSSSHKFPLCFIRSV